MKNVYLFGFISAFAVNILINVYSTDEVGGIEAAAVKGDKHSYSKAPSSEGPQVVVPHENNGLIVVDTGDKSSIVIIKQDVEDAISISQDYQETDRRSFQQSGSQQAFAPLAPDYREDYQISSEQDVTDVVHREAGGRVVDIASTMEGDTIKSDDVTLADSESSDGDTSSEDSSNYSNDPNYSGRYYNADAADLSPQVHCPDSLYMGGNSYAVNMLKKAGCPKPANYNGAW